MFALVIKRGTCITNMEISIGIGIGLLIALVIWRLQAKYNRLEEEAYRLFVEFHAVSNRCSEQEAEEAWTRYWME